jgi:hypothetical protein
MKTVILLRTHRFGAREAAFAGRLQVQSGHAVQVLADESQSVLETAPFGKVSMSPAIARAMNLPTPRDFAWRCGDYGFYAARRALPSVDRFYMIEPDVRFAVPDEGRIFARLDAMEADFLAPHVALADRAHFWYPTMRWLTPRVYNCAFAFCRMSAEAADLCLAERRRIAAFLPARLMWPNDETFVATTLKRLGRTVHDVNESGSALCTPESFGFAEVHRGEAIEAMAPDGLIYHPVLWGADYARKTQRIARGLSWGEIVRLKLLRGFGRARQIMGQAEESLR